MICPPYREVLLSIGREKKKKRTEAASFCNRDGKKKGEGRQGQRRFVFFQGRTYVVDKRR